MKLLHDLWTHPFGEYEDKNIRLLAILTSAILHIALLVGIAMLAKYNIPPLAPAHPDELGGMSGGGGGSSKHIEVEFGPSPGDEEAVTQDNEHTTRFRLVHLTILRSVDVGTPVIIRTKQKIRTFQKKSMGSSLAMNMPKRRIRGVGPGSGGGTGGGKGGGIGLGRGYSIDWGGTGTRRLLSGRLPQYPKGTDNEMPVTLQFLVFPNGSVSKITPTKRGDELLEREAITALETWRFDPLPERVIQTFQYGTVTFNFKLEHTVTQAKQ